MEPCSILTDEDYYLARDYLSTAGKSIFRPDLVIAPDGEPYLFRWHLARRKMHGSLYFHIQVKSDPERPLHDHPWDNMSTILAGGYDEQHQNRPHERSTIFTRSPRAGDVVFRKAEVAHRLTLPHGVRYTMTLFSCGPERREWGFWYPDGFHPFHQHVAERDGKSVHVNREEDHAAAVE